MDKPETAEGTQSDEDTAGWEEYDEGERAEYGMCGYDLALAAEE